MRSRGAIGGGLASLALVARRAGWLARVCRPALVRLMMAALALLGALAGPALAGAEPPVILETEAQVAGFPTIVVQAAIQDQRRQPIAGLTASDITIVEDGREIAPDSVVMLKDSPTPLALLIALDTGLSMSEGGRLEAAREGIKSILGRLRPADSAALVRFDTTFALANPFTRDKVVLTQTLDRLVAEGNRRLYDGAYLAVSEAARITGNRAVLLITSGDDVQSQVTLGTVKNLVADTGTKVYVVGVGDQVRDELLESLAKGSGGRYYKAIRAGDLPPVLRAAYDDFTSRYEVVYESPTRERAPGERIVAQMTVVAPGGATTAAIAYRLPRTDSVAVAAAPRRTIPLQVVPPRPVPPPLSDDVIVAAGLLTSFGVVLATLGLVIHQRRSVYDARLHAFVSSKVRYALEDRPPSLLQLVAALVVRSMAAVIIRLLPPHQVRQISRRLILAGAPFNWRVSHFLACKGLAALAGLMIGWVIPPSSPLMAVLSPLLLMIAGYILPEIWLNQRVRQRQRAILRALPNALDLLAISVEAGLSLDAAMLEVVHKWNNPFSEELSNVLADLKVGKSRRDALRGLAHRTELPEVTTFVSALIQADEIGLSIGRTLAIQAEQIRLRQRQRAERLAREASVKMLFPLALLIFPAIFVVILVPAIPVIMDTLRSLGG